MLTMEAVSGIKINTVPTAQHKLMKDSKVFIIPPDNFRLSLNSLTYVHPETGANLGVIQSFTSFSSIKKHLNQAYFNKKKYTLIKKTKYTINKMSAIFFELESVFYGNVTTKYILIIGNKNEYAMIEAYCPKKIPLAGFAIKKSLTTIYYDIDSVEIKKLFPIN